MEPCLLVWLGAAEAKDEQMAMGVCAGKALAVWGELAVEDSPVTLALDLREEPRHTSSAAHWRLRMLLRIDYRSTLSNTVRSQRCVYHVEVVLCVPSPQQVPDEDVPVMAGRQDDPGVEGVRLQDKHLGLVALNTTIPDGLISAVCFTFGPRWKTNNKLTLRMCSSCPV